jgi:hypothetical protein
MRGGAERHCGLDARLHEPVCAQGDMVIVLNDGSKIEIRSIDKWQEIKKHIEDKIEEAKAVKEKSWPTSAGVGSKAAATD